jgi:hypothetical protein
MSDSQGERVSSPKSSFVYSRPVLLRAPSVAERESRLCPRLTPLTHCHVVEQRKSRLTAKQSLRSNVDWLTEAIRRFSEAHALGRDFSTVTMSNVFRSEKVGGCILPLATFSHFRFTLY